MGKNIYTILIICILLLGFFLRIHTLGKESIWLDEAIAVFEARKSLPEIISYMASSDVHPPLYPILLHFWILPFGDKEFSVRFLSVIFGILTIVFVYKLGKLLFSPQAGIIASLFIAVSPFHIQYSQEARGYTLMSFLAVASFYFLSQLYARKKKSDVWGYGISTVFLLFTHYYGFFFWITQNLYFFSFKNKRNVSVKQWLMLQLSIALLFSVWIGFFLGQALRVWTEFWIQSPSYVSLFQSFKAYTGNEILLIFYILLSFFAFLQFKKNNGAHRNSMVLLLLWVAVPFGLSFLISILFVPIYHTRYFIGATIPLYFVAANAVLFLPRRWIQILIIGAVVIASLTADVSYYKEIKKQQWREVADVIAKNAHTNDVVLLHPTYADKGFLYYNRRTDITHKGFSDHSKPDSGRMVTEKDLKELVEIANKHKRIWVIVWVQGNSGGDIQKSFFSMKYSESYVKRFAGALKLSLYESTR